MDKQELKSFLKNYLYNVDGAVIRSHCIQSHLVKIDKYEQILRHTKEIEHEPLNRKIYHLLHDLDEIPKCQCGKPLTWQRAHYGKYCGSKCANTENSKLHGSPFANPETQQKAKDTWLKKYGVDNPWKAEEVKQTIQKNITEKYGCHHNLLDSTQRKAKQTSLDKYGKEHYSKTNEFKQTLTEYNQRNIPKEILEKIDDPNWLTEQHHVLNKTLLQISHENDLCQAAICDRFHKFGIEIKNTFSVSATEQEIADFLESLQINFIRNNRGIIKPKELDFFLPDHNIAIEYNGIYYHTTQFVTKSHHIDKTLKCLEQNIRLFHILEHEWITKKDIWKSMLKNAICGQSNRIFARNCEIRNIRYSETEAFLKQNHLQSSIKTNINIGLYHNDVLVSIMTFQKPRFTDKYDYELIRFASLLNTQVIGGASKLLNNFRQRYKPKSIISYADRRYSNGKLYEKIGFTQSHITDTGYFYVKGGKIFNRQQFQKHKLKGILSDYSPELTEEENMLRNGYFRLYDCGQLVYTMCSGAV